MIDDINAIVIGLVCIVIAYDVIFGEWFESNVCFYIVLDGVA